MKRIEIAERALRKLLDDELGDYSYYTEGMELTASEIHNEDFYFDVNFPEGSWNSLDVRVSNVPDELPLEDDWETVDEKLESICKIEVCMYEDVYEAVVNYDWRVRYLWQALLWK